MWTAYPIRNSLLDAVGSVCQELGIPHIIVHWMPEDFVPNSENHIYTRSIFPEPNLFATALKHIIVDYQWNGFTLIYEDNDSIFTLAFQQKKES